MEAIDTERLTEQVLIWATALVLAFAGFAAARRAFPGPFAAAGAQLSIESRNLAWTAADLREGRLTVLKGPSGLSLNGLRRSLDDENARLASRVGGHVVVQREDLLERANRGLR